MENTYTVRYNADLLTKVKAKSEVEAILKVERAGQELLKQALEQGREDNRVSISIELA